MEGQKKILGLWSTPRSRSTAFMWMMKNRGDFVVFLEPFGKSAYYSQERIFTFDADQTSNPEYNYQNVLQKLVSTFQQSNVFIKDFPLYFVHIVDDKFLSIFEHTFLIRNPAQMLPSYFYKWPSLIFEETGYRQLYQLFDRVMNFTDQIPPVIDADDLVENPQSIIRAFCEKVGIVFKADALAWNPPGKKVKQMCWWEEGSWHNELSVTKGFSEQTRPEYLKINDSDRLKKLYEMCFPYYEKMYEYRIKPI